MSVKHIMAKLFTPTIAFVSFGLLVMIISSHQFVGTAIKDAPVSIVEKELKKGDNFSTTVVSYDAFDQCMPKGMEQKIGSHRLLFHCMQNAGLEQNCTAARLLVCHPSKLHPKSYPDEGYKDVEIQQTKVLTRSGAMTKLVINADNPISKNCKQMMNECMGNTMCRGTMTEMGGRDGEIWHGFLVRREGTNFVVELPFGTESYNISIPESKNFLLNFGTEKDARKTFIEYEDKDGLGVKSTLEGDSEKFYAKYLEEFSAEGMPASVQKHLWLLGLDLLPNEEHQRIRFYTKQFPSLVRKEVCNRIENGLKMEKEESIGLINATYFSPINDGDKLAVFPDVEVKINPDVGKTIKVGNGGLTQKRSRYLAHSQFFVHGRVAKDAKNIRILLFQGTDKPSEILGQTVLEIRAIAQDANAPLDCKTNFFPKNEMQDCKFSIGNGGFERGNDFWIWIKIENGGVELSVNCIIQKFTWEDPLYSLESNILLEGDFELIGEKALIDEKGETIDRNSFKNLVGRTLYVQEFPGNEIKDGTIIMLNQEKLGKLKDLKELEFALFSSDEKTVEMIAKMKVKEGNKDVKECANLHGCKCLNILGNLHATCSDKLKLILIYKIGKEEGQQESFDIFVDGMKLPNNTKLEKETKVQDANIIQFKGDIRMPEKNLFQYALLKKNEKESANYIELQGKIDFMRPLEYVIIYAVVVNSLAESTNDGISFVVKLNCMKKDECYLKSADKTTLHLDFDMNEKCVKARAYKQEKSKRVDGPSDTICDSVKNFPISLGETFWLKIFINPETKNYEISVNGDSFFKIEYDLYSDMTGVLVNEIKVESGREESDVSVLNSLQFLPYRKRLRSKEDAEFPANSIITIEAQILKNAGEVELFLVKYIKNEEVDDFCLGDVDKILKDEFGVVILHIKKRDGKYCVSKELKPTCDLNDVTIPNAELVFGKNYKLKLSLISIDHIDLQLSDQAKAYNLISIENINVQKIGKYGVLEATHILLCGDIALVSEPVIDIPVVNGTTTASLE